MDQTIYHVLLEGRKVGPYDRRTIVGMRIKKTLTSDHVLIGTDGTQLTVGELIGQRPAKPFSADRSGRFSLVHATFTASVVELEGEGIPIPRFKGEVEARVQADVLRIAGRFRQGLGWKEDRIKIPLKEVVHARINGSQADLWLRPAQPGARMQRVSLELFTHEAAGELVDWFHGATPWPESGAPAPAPRRVDDKVLWVAGTGLAGAVTVLVVLIVVAAVQGRAY
ncbi:MAG: hypothetical protein Q8R33_24025 [Burkholderiales bacterium]|nr:hypothetical protein [Burkholderiales bacterium]